MLERSGFDVRVADSLPEASQWLREAEPEVLLVFAPEQGLPPEAGSLVRRLVAARCVLVGAGTAGLGDAASRVHAIPPADASDLTIFAEIIRAHTRGVQEQDWHRRRAVETGRLRRRIRALAEVRELCLRMFSTLDLRRAMEDLAAEMRGLLGACPAAIFVYDETDEHLVLEARSASDAQGLDVALEATTLAQRIYSTCEGCGEAVWTRDGDWAAATIAAQGQIHGVILSRFPADHDQCDLYQEIMLTTASAAAHVIRVCRDYEAASHKAEHLHELVELGQSINAITDLQTVMDTVVSSASRLTGAKRSSLMLIEEQTQTLRIGAAIGVPHEIIDSTRVPVGSRIAGLVAETGRAILANHHTTVPAGGIANDPSQYDSSSFLSVPLSIRGRVVGVLNLSNKMPDPEFTRTDEEVASLLGSHAAVAIENASLYSNLMELAATDGLTGLYNHQHFFAQLRASVNFARRTRQPLAVVLLDIDHFKRVNDTHGHAQGDKVLRAMSAIVRRTARAEDVAARYGGEEFAVILPNTTANGAVLLGERIRARVAALHFEHRGQVFQLTISAGVADLADDIGTRVLVDRADRALYRSKRDGRDRLSVFDPQLDGE